MYRLDFFIATLFAYAAVLPAFAAPDGAKLYAQNCAACHGESGAGGIGIPLALPSFQATIDDSYLSNTIRNGRPGRVMPAFPQLKEDELTAIVKHVRSWYQGEIARFSTQTLKGNPVRGQQLFATHCAACHGASGEGGKGTGVTFSRPRELPITAPALHNPGFLASARDEMLKKVMLEGRPGTPMVSFLKAGLSDSDINDIVSYVRSFEKQALSQSAEILSVETPVIVRESSYDLRTTVNNLKQAIASNNFFVGREQPLEYGLTTPEQANPRQVIVYFCNISLLPSAIRGPGWDYSSCRVTVTEHQGKVTLRSVNPEVLSKLFNNSELNELCKQMRQNYINIMEEATL